MPELSAEHFPVARPLLADLEKTHALVSAIFEANLPARIFVNDIQTPSTAVAVYNSRVLCAGIPADLDSLSQWFHQQLLPSHLEAGNEAYLVCYSEDAWRTALEILFDGNQVFHGERQYFEIQDLQTGALPPLPDGFSMQPVTPEFLASGLTGLDTIREEMCSERVSLEDFLAHSFGVCPVFEGEVAGWCLSEYNTGSRCEIGIATAEKHQRKGLATLSTKYFLAQACQRGYRQVGWDCWKRNEASAAAARKAGLTLVEEYPALVVLFGKEK